MVLHHFENHPATAHRNLWFSWHQPASIPELCCFSAVRSLSWDVNGFSLYGCCLHTCVFQHWLFLTEQLHFLSNWGRNSTFNGPSYFLVSHGMNHTGWRLASMMLGISGGSWDGSFRRLFWLNMPMSASTLQRAHCCWVWGSSWNLLLPLPVNVTLPFMARYCKGTELWSDSFVMRSLSSLRHMLSSYSACTWWSVAA